METASRTPDCRRLDPLVILARCDSSCDQPCSPSLQPSLQSNPLCVCVCGIASTSAADKDFVHSAAFDARPSRAVKFDDAVSLGRSQPRRALRPPPLIGRQRRRMADSERKHKRASVAACRPLAESPSTLYPSLLPTPAQLHYRIRPSDCVRTKTALMTGPAITSRR